MAPRPADPVFLPDLAFGLFLALFFVLELGFAAARFFAFGLLFALFFEPALRGAEPAARLGERFADFRVRFLAGKPCASPE